MIFKGFRFGMLLQLAVGPMCLLVFNTSASNGFFSGFMLVLAIALVDIVYMALSGLGVASIISKQKAKLMLKLLGGAVLMLFGINMVLGEFSIRLLPALTPHSDISSQNIFIQGVLLTASNPLTIIFWSSVFSAQVIEHGLNKRQLVLFGAGCLLATLSFMTAVDILGLAANAFLPGIVIKILNIGVGIMLGYFGLRLLLKKETASCQKE